VFSNHIFILHFAVMLSRLVTVEAVEKALKTKERMEEHQVECHPVLVTMACIDDAVDMKLV
jgi:hypothetical protein